MRFLMAPAECARSPHSPAGARRRRAGRRRAAAGPRLRLDGVAGVHDGERPVWPDLLAKRGKVRQAHRRVDRVGGACASPAKLHHREPDRADVDAVTIPPRSGRRRSRACSRQQRWRAAEEVGRSAERRDHLFENSAALPNSARRAAASLPPRRCGRGRPDAEARRERQRHPTDHRQKGISIGARRGKVAVTRFIAGYLARVKRDDRR